MIEYSDSSIQKLMVSVLKDAAQRSELGDVYSVAWLMSEEAETFCVALSFDWHQVRKWAIRVFAKHLQKTRRNGEVMTH